MPPDPRQRSNPRQQLDEARQRTQWRERQALIIAPGLHEATAFDLPAVHDDAEAIRKLLVDPDCGRFPKDNVEVLEGEKASTGEIRIKLGNLARKAGKDGLTFILFIGHAVVTEHGPCFITHDTTPQSVQDTALSKVLLIDLMRRFKTHSLFVAFDCCHAGSFADILPERTRALPSPEDLLSDFQGEGRVVLAAAGAGQKAVEGKRGYLSLALEEGLGGKADRDNKGVVTVEDLGAYVKARVQELGSQEPQLTGRFTKDFALTLNRERVQQLVSAANLQDEAIAAVDRWGSRAKHNPHGLTDQEQEVILAVLENPDAIEDDPTFHNDKECLHALVFQHRSDGPCPRPIKQLAHHVALQKRLGPASQWDASILEHKTKADAFEKQWLAQRREAELAQASLKAASAETERHRTEAHALAQQVTALSEALQSTQQEADALQHQARDWQAKAQEAGDRATQAAAEAEAARQAHALSSAAESKALARANETAALAADERRRMAEEQSRTQADLAATQVQLNALREALRGVNEARDAAEARAAQAEAQSKAATAAQQQLAAAEAELSGRLNQASRRTSSLRMSLFVTTVAAVSLAVSTGVGFNKAEAIRRQAGSALSDLDKAREENTRLSNEIRSLRNSGLRPSEVPLNAPFTNSLGMRFAPVPGVQALFSVWETRVQDYEAFAKTRTSGDTSWRNPDFLGAAVTPGPTHPVVAVSWNDARDFCQWLTSTERKAGTLPANRRYRLPTDLEWSAAVGLPREQGATPKERDEKISGVYPWGTQWPPPRGAGNFGDVTCKKAWGNNLGSTWTFIEGYEDGFATTSPVGSFPSSSSGLHDLAGNVWEWCDDWYDTPQTGRVLRGGAWSSGGPRNLLSSCRRNDEPDERDGGGGFRVVLGVDEPAR